MVYKFVWLFSANHRCVLWSDDQRESSIFVAVNLWAFLSKFPCQTQKISCKFFDPSPGRSREGHFVTPPLNNSQHVNPDSISANVEDIKLKNSSPTVSILKKESGCLKILVFLKQLIATWVGEDLMGEFSWWEEFLEVDTVQNRFLWPTTQATGYSMWNMI